MLKDTLSIPDELGNQYLKADSPLNEDIELIEKNKETVKQFIGNLIQAIENKYILIITEPPRKSEAGNFHILISFTCAILPTAYNTNLIIVPDKQAGETLKSHKSATLLDYQGQYKFGEKLCADINHHADVIVEQVLAKTNLQTPQCLQIFKQYLAEIVLNIDAIPDVINNTLAQNILENKPEQIITQLLQDNQISYALEKQIVGLKQHEFEKLSKLIEISVTNWWQKPFFPEKMRHLFKLISYKPPLISTSLVRKLVLLVSVEDIVASQLTDEESFRVIQWEFEQGDISRWREENLLLAKFATYDFDNFKRLVKQISEKNLNSVWLNSYFDNLNEDTLPQVAEYLLNLSPNWQVLEHKNFPHPIKVLCDKLKNINLPASLSKSLINAGNKIKPSKSTTENLQKNLEIYVRLADLIVGDNLLVEQLWKKPELTLLELDSVVYLFNIAKDYEVINQKIWKNGGLETSTAILLENNNWYNWFQIVEFTKKQQHKLGLAWLKCPIWENWNNRWEQPEPTMEAWHSVIGCLGDGLHSLDMQEIIRHMPNIKPFEEKQRADLYAIAMELGAIIILAKEFKEPTEKIKNKTRLKKLTYNLLDWLLDRKEKYLNFTFKQAKFIYQNYPIPKTKMALEQTILNSFDEQPEKMLKEVFELNIFKTNTHFLKKLGNWVNSIKSVTQISPFILKRLDDWLKNADNTDNFFDPKMPIELVEQYPNIAAFIYSTETIEKIRNEKQISLNKEEILEQQKILKMPAKIKWYQVLLNKLKNTNP